MTRRSIRLCGQVIQEPGHICAFFNSRDEEYDTLLPYLKDGVDSGERVVNVIDHERIGDHKQRLESAGIPSNDGGVLLSSAEETYLADGKFDMERMVDFVRGNLVEAAASGQLVRTAGWMDWLQREVPGTDRVMEYEARMNLLVPDFNCTFMCVYDISKLAGSMVVDIMATHPHVLLGGRVRSNPFYIRPDEYLKSLGKHVS